MIVRPEALKVLARYRTNEAVIPAMMAAWEWPAYTNRPELDFPIRILMGHNAGVGLGVALACPDRKVWVLNGDGSQLMYLGYITDIANAGAKNLILFVFENGQYEITGGQPIPLREELDLALAAKGLGIKNSCCFDDMAEFEAKIPEILKMEGPTFVVLKVVPGSPVKTPKPDVLEDIRKFRAALQTTP